MSDSVPDYYRHLADKSEETKPETSADAQENRAETDDSQHTEPPKEHYRADAFRMALPDGDWTDRTLYTITGPTTGGIQHNITVTLEHEPEADALDDFAEQQVASLEPRLDDCRVLMEDQIELIDGTPAHRAIFVWHPEDDLRLYQEQLYVLHDGCGYTLTASFTRKTRKRLGPQVERMMRSFTPALDRKKQR